MVNTNLEYWSADGVSLETWAWNISTLAGRMKPPPLRGTDIIIPYAIGERWVEKVPGSQVLQLSMWIKGSDEDGGVPLGRTAKMQFDENWRQLQNLLWTPGRQFNLTKQFTVNGVMRSATAKAEYAGGMEPTMIGRRGAKFMVNLKLADPYFYDDDLTTQVLVAGHQDVVIPGQARTYNIEINIDGPRNTLEFMNWTTEANMQFDRITDGDEEHSIDVKNWESWLMPDGGGIYPTDGFVSRSGGPMWWSLDPGINDIEVIENTSPSLGPITLSVRGAWL